jgi:hypothetical protein
MIRVYFAVMQVSFDGRFRGSHGVHHAGIYRATKLEKECKKEEKFAVLIAHSKLVEQASLSNVINWVGAS